MSRRAGLARGLLRLGAFVQTLAVAVMRPDDLVEFSRQGYARPGRATGWAEDALVDAGLTREEQELLAEAPAAPGDLLLLGVGGGREAIPLARLGYRVTGVDYVAAMVDLAKENAERRGVRIEGLVQEMSQLDVAAEAFDVVWLSRALYSCVPTRRRRVELVRRVACGLRPGGVFLCQFQSRAGKRPHGRGERLRRAAAALALNPAYEAGDTLWLNVEFLHEFSSADEIRSELEEGGLAVLRIGLAAGGGRGSAVCRKEPASSKEGRKA